MTEDEINVLSKEKPSEKGQDVKAFKIIKTVGRRQIIKQRT